MRESEETKIKTQFWGLKRSLYDYRIFIKASVFFPELQESSSADCACIRQDILIVIRTPIYVTTPGADLIELLSRWNCLPEKFT